MQMFRINHATPSLAVFCLACFATALSAQKPAAVDQMVLKNAGTPKDEFPGSWLNYGKSQGEMRYSALKQIDASNVKRLGLEWTYVLGAGGGNQEATPLVWTNTIMASLRGAWCLHWMAGRVRRSGGGIPSSIRAPCGNKPA